MPSLKKQIEKARCEAEEFRVTSRRLAEALEERTKQLAVLEEERSRFQTSIAQLLDERTKQVAVLEEETNHFHGRIAHLVEEHAHQIEKC